MIDLRLCAKDAWSGIGSDCRDASPVENRERISEGLAPDANSGDDDDGDGDGDGDDGGGLFER